MSRAQWKEVKGHKDYLVSDKGEILSMKNGDEPRIVSKEKIQKDAKTGFSIVVMDGIEELLHVVVARAFLGNIDAYSGVVHKNGDINDNRASNLKIVSKLERKREVKEAKAVTKKEQKVEMVKITKVVDTTKKTAGNNETGKRRGASKKPLYAINLNTGVKTKFASVSDAAKELGISAGNISSVTTGRTKSTCGYTFKKIYTMPRKWSRKAAPIMVENVKTGETKVYRSSTEASQQVGVTRRTIAHNLDNKSIAKGTYRFTSISEEKYLEMKAQQEATPKKISIERSDAKEWNGTGFKPVPVYVMEHKTNKLRCFDSISDAARKLGVSLAVVRDILDGKKVAEGYSFSKDFAEIQKAS